MAWEYGPIAAGALSVLISFIFIFQSPLLIFSILPLPRLINKEGRWEATFFGGNGSALEKSRMYKA
jgi:hypothetical protein